MGTKVLEMAYVAPTNLEEAHRRKDQVVLEIQTIQSQLGDPDRQVNGRRMEQHEWWQWRKKATYCLAARLSELRKLKAYLQEEIVNRKDGRGFPDDVREAFKTIKAYLARLENENRQLREANSALRSGTSQNGN